MTASLTWSNWSGAITCHPRRFEQPVSEAALATLVRETRDSGLPIRVAGTGHSFVPVCLTDGLLISLDGVQGLISADRERCEATFWAGTKLHQVGQPLLDHGLAMTNMGDIDRQALAGAVSTGTHGTGPTLGNISSQVVGLRLVLASGELLDCSPDANREIWEAARVANGALGILSRITLRASPAYRLHERTWLEPFEQAFAHIDESIAATRHFEFFWNPQADMCAMKSLQPTTAERLENPAPLPKVEGRLARYVQPERIDWSYKILPSERTLKFNEMEFAVPAEHGPDCMREIRDLMRRRHPDVAWPVEYRTVKADDIPLSPAYGRETITISIHQAAELSYQAFFDDAEAIFRNYNGRPHWGKLHRHTARDFSQLYPRWAEFLALRERLDPTGRFLNDHLRTVFGA